MPSHIENHLTMIADKPERLQEIAEAIRHDEHGVGSIDFEKIIPMPPELKVTSGSDPWKALEFYTQYVKHEHDADPSARERLIQEHQADQKLLDFGKQLYENKQQYGAAGWYDWSIQNWDTQWNSYEHRALYTQDNSAHINFDTAWSHPAPVIIALSQMFPDVRFRHRWADEDIGSNVGEAILQNGELLDWNLPDCDSKEAFELAAEIKGVVLSEWSFYYNEKTGTYEYRDEEVEANPPTPNLADQLKQNAQKSKEHTSPNPNQNKGGDCL